MTPQQPQTPPPVVLQIQDVTMAAQNGFTPQTPPLPRVVLQIQDSFVQLGGKTNG